MEYDLKYISPAGIAEAINKVELYRSSQRAGRGRVDLPRYPERRAGASTRFASAGAYPYGPIRGRRLRSLPGDGTDFSTAQGSV